MNLIKHIYGLIILLLTALTSIAQQVSLDRVLVGSGFTEYSSSQFNLSASIGEPVIQTLGASQLILTQGFQQSNYVLNNPFILELTATSAACFGANDGAVTVGFISENISPPHSYSWSNGEDGPGLTQVESGTYSLTVTGSNGQSVTNSVSVGAVDSVDCAPGFYIGITPNNDDFNDYWHIDNAEFFATKNVKVFNRYGGLVWETADYDNLESPFVGQHINGSELPDGTYYFIAKFDDSTYKGWIEISR